MIKDRSPVVVILSTHICRSKGNHNSWSSLDQNNCRKQLLTCIIRWYTTVVAEDVLRKCVWKLYNARNRMSFISDGLRPYFRQKLCQDISQSGNGCAWEIDLSYLRPQLAEIWTFENIRSYSRNKMKIGQGCWEINLWYLRAQLGEIWSM